MIELARVGKDYRGRAALVDVSFVAEKGEFVFVTGHSGAGKTTLLRLAYCAERPDRGRISVAGFDLSRIAAGSIPYLRRNIGVVFQDFKLIGSFSVFDNVAVALEVLGTPPGRLRRKVFQTLQRVGLHGKSDRRPETLSAGEQQRVAIARAIVNDPVLLLADEPTGNLDPAMSAEITELLSDIALRGTTVLVATHDYEQMRRYPQLRHLHLAHGRVMSDGPVGQFLAHEREGEAR